MIWEKPLIYVLIHIISGAVGYIIPFLLYLAIAYHLLQYVFNTRFFAFEMAFRGGNSMEHTAVKLVEIAIGYSSMMLIDSTKKGHKFLDKWRDVFSCFPFPQGL